MSDWYERRQKHSITGIDDKLQDLGFEITNRRGSSNWTAERGPITVRKHSSGDGTGFVVLVGGTEKKKFSYFDKKEVLPYVKNLSAYQREASLTKSLIKLGHEQPELREHLRPILDRISSLKTGYDTPEELVSSLKHNSQWTGHEVRESAESIARKIRKSFDDPFFSEISDKLEVAAENYPPEDISTVLRESAKKIERRKTSNNKQAVMKTNILYKIVDKKEVKGLQRELDGPLEDKLMDILMEFHKRLNLDDETQRALNRFSNLLKSNTPPQAKVNQLRKVADELGLGFH